MIYVGNGDNAQGRKCYANEWSCNNGDCIPIYHRCDNHLHDLGPDCSDGSDESEETCGRTGLQIYCNYELFPIFYLDLIVNLFLHVYDFIIADIKCPPECKNCPSESGYSYSSDTTCNEFCVTSGSYGKLKLCGPMYTDGFDCRRCGK